jgi:hypothetical protein
MCIIMIRLFFFTVECDWVINQRKLCRFKECAEHEQIYSSHYGWQICLLDSFFLLFAYEVI